MGRPGEDPVAIEEWVAEFDRLCVETAEALSDPGLTDEEFATVSNAALAEMRAIGEPSTQADHAATLLEVIETQSNDSDLTGEESEALDSRFLEAATALGISDACLGGAAG